MGKGTEWEEGRGGIIETRRDSWVYRVWETGGTVKTAGAGREGWGDSVESQGRVDMLSFCGTWT